MTDISDITSSLYLEVRFKTRDVNSDHPRPPFEAGAGSVLKLTSSLSPILGRDQDIFLTKLLPELLLAEGENFPAPSVFLSDEFKKMGRPEINVRSIRKTNEGLHCHLKFPFARYMEFIFANESDRYKNAKS